MIELSYFVIFNKKGTRVSQALDLLKNTLQSFVSQTLQVADLTIICDTSCGNKVNALVESTLPQDLSQRVRITFQSDANYLATLNCSFESAKGNWISVIPLGDVLNPYATYLFLYQALSKPKSFLVYCDQDFFTEKGDSSRPFYKPEFSIDLLYSQNYIGDFFIFNKQALNRIGGLDECMTENWSYDLILRLLELCYSEILCLKDKILDNNSLRKHFFIHIPEIIHHQQSINSDCLIKTALKSSKSTKQVTKRKQGLFALNRHLVKVGHEVVVTEIKPFVYRQQWVHKSAEPLVSLIIPTRNGYQILKSCVESIIGKTTYSNYEIIIVDNQSTDKRTLQYLNRIQSDYDFIRVLRYNKSFNYSDINNFASEQANGSILGFVNNDIEVITPEWLSEMVSHVIRPDIGCVGALLFYPDGTIQHGGVVVGMHGVADHAFKAMDPADVETDYFDLLKSVHNPDAVTAATLLIRKDLFDEVGRFDHKDLVVAFNDVDLCLKVKKRGYRNLFTPYAQLIHHESKTRSKDVSVESRQREIYEHSIMKSRWKTHKTDRRHLLKLYSQCLTG